MDTPNWFLYIICVYIKLTSRQLLHKKQSLTVSKNIPSRHISTYLHFYWSACIKPGMWADMFLCLGGVSNFISFYDLLSLGFWNCSDSAILFVFHFISFNFRFMAFNATFNNISAISWRSVLLVEEAGENHRPVASHWQTLSHTVASVKPRHERGSNSQL
jgi:hypothetical protein